MSASPATVNDNLLPQHSHSSQSLPSLGTGVDISFPQCAARSHIALPAQFSFAIVGVNGGTASRLNPCFRSEYNSALLLAGPTEQPCSCGHLVAGR
jgi:hypothetical protein